MRPVFYGKLFVSESNVSIVIVNYNAGDVLLQCLSAALKASNLTEILLVDNASHDDSLSQVQQQFGHDTRLNIIEHDDNLGFAGGANSVLSQVKGDYVLFLNPDCLIKPDSLLLFCRLLDKYPQAGMAGALVRNLDGSEQTSCRREIPTPWKTLTRALYLHRLFPQYPHFQGFEQTQYIALPSQPISLEGISGACMFVRREALDNVGPMDEDYFLHCEDLDWFMRFHAENWQILFAPHIEVTHIQGSCSQSHPIKILWYKHRGMLRFYRKFFHKVYPLPLFWGVTAAVWLRFSLLASNVWVKRLLSR